MMIHFRLLGYHFYVSRCSRKPDNNHYNRQQHKLRRLKMANRHCEICGKEIDQDCSYICTLPLGSPDRHTAENIKVACRDCKSNHQNQNI